MTTIDEQQVVEATKQNPAASSLLRQLWAALQRAEERVRQLEAKCAHNAGMIEDMRQRGQVLESELKDKREAVEDLTNENVKLRRRALCEHGMTNTHDGKCLECP